MNDRLAVRVALQIAIEYEKSFIDSYPKNSVDPAVVRAKNRISDFERVLKRRYDYVIKDPLADAKTISIYDIKG